MKVFTKRESKDEFVRAAIYFAEHYAEDPSGVSFGEDGILAVDGHQVDLQEFRHDWDSLEEAERKPWLARAIRTVVTEEGPPTDFDVSCLRVVIRPRSVFEANVLRKNAVPLRAGATPESPELPHEPIGGDLAWAVVWDEPQILGVINHDHLKSWQMTFDEVFDIALENVATHEFQGWRVVDEGVYCPRGDVYAGSIPFLPGALMPLGLEGDGVVFPATRALSYVACAADPDALGRAAALALDHEGDPDRLPMNPMICRDGRWDAHWVSEHHPAHASLFSLSTLGAEQAYTEQHDALELVAKTGTTVSPFTTYETADGFIRSVTAWIEGTTSWIAIADRLAFVMASGDVLMVPWDIAQTIVGHRLEPTAHYPARYEASSFPSAAEFDQLEKYAVEG